MIYLICRADGIVTNMKRFESFDEVEKALLSMSDVAFMFNLSRYIRYILEDRYRVSVLKDEL